MSTQEAHLEQLLAQARNCRQAGDMQGAAEIYQRILERDDSQAETLFHLGRFQITQDLLHEACDTLSKAVAAQPEVFRYQCALAQACEHLGRTDEAICYYQQALELNPHSVAVLGRLGYLFHTQSRYQQAEQYFLEALRLNDQSAQAHYNLAITLFQQGQHQESVQLMRQALALDPNFLEARFKLGKIYKRMAQFSEAEACFDLVLQSDPGNRAARLSLCNIRLKAGRYQEAVDYYKAFLQDFPGDVTALSNLGAALFKLQAFEQAMLYCRQALALNPGYADARNNLTCALNQIGLSHQQAGRYQEAEQRFREVLALDETVAGAHVNLAVTLYWQRRYDETIAHLKQALVLEPDLIDAQSKLAKVYEDLGQYEEAEACYRQILQLDPEDESSLRGLCDLSFKAGRYEEAAAAYRCFLQTFSQSATAYNNLGATLHRLGRFEEALAAFDMAQALDPEHNIHLYNKGMLLLLLQCFEEGWEDCEFRHYNKARIASATRPVWDGSDLHGQRLLVLTEQGYGDTFQTLRYLSLVKAKGATVVFECKPEMMSLLATCPYIDKLLPESKTMPPEEEYDTYISMMSLPYVFGTKLETIPPVIDGLIMPNEKDVRQWQGFFEGDNGYKVGIVWSGKHTNPGNSYRSCTLSHFEILADLPGVSFYSLQVGPEASQVQSPPEGMRLTDLGPKLTDFAQTAAAISCLDLVITVDTSVAHLAGTLKKPVWVILGYVPDWRWFLDRNDSPWYPATMSLFRQPVAHDWDSVFAQLRTALEARLNDNG